MRPDARGARVLFALALVLGTALRLYPQHHFQPGPELQVHFPRNAVLDVVDHNWKPFAVLHGAAYLDLLRLVYSVWYAVGHLAGRYHDRLDFLVAFVRDPLPFVFVGRALIIGLAVATLWLVGRLGTRVFGPWAGASATLVLAVTFVHVRESHHVWLDVPAGFGCLLATAVAIRVVRGAGLGWTLLLGAATGMAVAANHRVFPVVVVPAVAVPLATGVSPRALARHLAILALGGLATFSVLSPYLLLELGDALRQASGQPGLWLSGIIGGGLPIPTLLRIGIGIAPLSIAILGLAAGLRRTPREATVCAVFPIAYLVMLSVVAFRFTRYLAPLAPFVALFAGAGIAALGSLLTPHRPTLGTVAAALVVVALPLGQSVAYDRLRGRTDTRILAGEWIMAHVPPGTAIGLPNLVYYPNPVLPPDETALHFAWPSHLAELKRRGLPDPARVWPGEYEGFFHSHRADWTPTKRFIVTVHHPVVTHGMNTPAEQIEKIKAAGGTIVAAFPGVDDPLPAGVLFDPLCADYLPIVGFGSVTRPGPNLTIWEIPPPAR